MTREAHRPVVGSVSFWDDAAGQGVLLTPDGLTVVCHMYQVEVAGCRRAKVGAEVVFDYETPGQDGRDARVLTGARPASEVGIDTVPLGSLHQPDQMSDGLYASTVTVRWVPPPEA